ncbi:MAG: alanine racemase [Endozoicomonadaceae bacterium]|nr:alanine racemase [Endozoicomonadaceae bacterium]MBE8233650.1 alanine racemase [Endozoicomonadaceae bacterium]
MNNTSEHATIGRPAEAIINLDALRHNFRLARQLTRSAITSVLKSNAYGHGAVVCAKVLEDEGSDAFAVACIQEAIELRHHHITKPIILLEGFFHYSELKLIQKYQLTPIIHHQEQINMLGSSRLKKPIHTWFKVDTGMNRLGFSYQNCLKPYQQLQHYLHNKTSVIATHFARAQYPSDPFTALQIQRFKNLPFIQKHQISLSNSAAILHDYQIQDHWVRPGIMLTGVSPLFHIQSHIALKPIMTLQTRIIAIKDVESNQFIGYTNCFQSTHKMRIGLAAIGYGDGYPQQLPAGTPVFVAGYKTRIVGAVAMDIVTIDLTACPQAKLGSCVTLWGNQLPVSDIAQYANSIPYALLSNIKRIPKRYTGEITASKEQTDLILEKHNPS